MRCLSTPVEPKEKAHSIVDALPGNNLISKTGILATSAAATIYGISNELIVLHDETILVVTFSTFVALCAKFVAPLYTEWADGEIKKVNDLLNESKNKHVTAVKGRIESVSQLKDVVSTTKQLFDISRETAKLEAETFELKQKLAVANEAKATLDSWVRFEQQQRQLEQEQLIKAIIREDGTLRIALVRVFFSTTSGTQFRTMVGRHSAISLEVLDCRNGKGARSKL